MKTLFLIMALIAAEPDAPESVLSQFFTAFNNHDPAAMEALAAPDIRTTYLDTDGGAETVTGAAALREGMEDYFAGLPDVRSEFEILGAAAGQVSIRETVFWTGQDGAVRSQSAYSVYRIEDGQIAQVWYMPAFTD